VNFWCSRETGWLSGEPHTLEKKRPATIYELLKSIEINRNLNAAVPHALI